MKPRFKKSDRSSFAYWFAHWAAFQMVALNLGIWTPRYLFHDFEKPWLKLFLPYHTVQKFHRRNNRHHISFRSPERIDWVGLVIDWECCRFTKIECPLNARQTYEAVMEGRGKEVLGREIEPEMIERMERNIPLVLEILGL